MARSSGAGSTTLPIGSLYAAAAVNFRLREVVVWNTTTTAVALKIVRLSTTGTQGTALTEVGHDSSSVAPSCAAFNTHSVLPTLAGDIYPITLGAAIGSGAIITFGGDVGVNVNVGTGNGIGIIVATGTGQICDFGFVWEE